MPSKHRISYLAAIKKVLNNFCPAVGIAKFVNSVSYLSEVLQVVKIHRVNDYAK